MTSLARRLARPEILDLPPIGKVAGTSEDYAEDIVRLNLNENWQPPLAQSAESQFVNRYPEPSAPLLRRAMARLYEVESENLLVTRGADEAIDILIRTFCRAGEDAILVCEPTFGAYALVAKIQGARIVSCKYEEDFSFNAERFIEAARGNSQVKLAFLCSPNNPTGSTIQPTDALKVADALGDVIVVVDEAYIEFSEIQSLANEATLRDNLVVLRTLSKAYGIAGARVGCAISNAELIDIIARALPPFPLASPSISIALATLGASRRLLHSERIQRIVSERERMLEKLPASPLVSGVWPSEANFLLLEVRKREQVERELKQRAVRVRWRPDIGENVLRLSIGSREDNALALAAFGLGDEATLARRSEMVRDTAETRIAVAVDLDRPAPRKVQTGLPFFDHMLDQVATHGGFSLLLACEGDLKVDPHHSVEDCALALGQALSKALGERSGIGRFGFALPMDEAEAQVLIDLSGRPYSRFEGSFGASHLGDYPTEMTRHVFRSLAQALGAAIHVRVTGENDHHKTEACFKALGRALRQAIAREGNDIPSTKGVLA